MSVCWPAIFAQNKLSDILDGLPQTSIPLFFIQDIYVLTKHLQNGAFDCQLANIFMFARYRDAEFIPDKKQHASILTVSIWLKNCLFRSCYQISLASIFP